MTPEQLLLAAVTSVTTALLWVTGKLWARSEQCEKDRVELRQMVEKLLVEAGEYRGELHAYRRCGEDECPFRGGLPIKA